MSGRLVLKNTRPPKIVLWFTPCSPRPVFRSKNQPSGLVVASVVSQPVAVVKSFIVLPSRLTGSPVVANVSMYMYARFVTGVVYG